MKNYNNHSGYSVIIALFVMSFLLVLTTGIFRLVLSELTLNRGEQGYLQAYAGAISARELALLHIKNNGYGNYNFIAHDVNNRSVILTGKNMSEFNLNKDIFISYDLGYKTSKYEGNLEGFGYDIIPLFSDNISISDLDLTVIKGEKQKLIWNILGDNSGLAGLGDFNKNTPGKSRVLEGINIDFSNSSVGEFLAREDTQYLIVFNSSNDTIHYELTSPQGQYFTLPRTNIISSGQVGKFRQNLTTGFDNTEFLGILRYSIFSPNSQ